MKKSLVLAMAMALGVTASAYAANPFTDVPAGHWAYDSISKLAAAGVIEGYGDDTFRGDRLMTRYEMAQIVAKAMAKGANVDKLAAEFADELDALGVRVAALEKKTDNVKINGQIRYRWRMGSMGNRAAKPKNHDLRSRLWFRGTINENWQYVGMIENTQNFVNNTATTAPIGVDPDDTTYFQRAYVEGRLGGARVTAGRYHDELVGGDSDVYSHRIDGIKAQYGDKVKLMGWYGKTTGNDNLSNIGGKYSWGAHLDFALGKNANLFLGYDEFKAPGATVTAGVPIRANDKRKIFDVGAKAKFKDVKLTAIYLHGKSDVEAVTDKKSGFTVEAAYKGANAKKPGTWGVNVKYYNQGNLTYLAPGTFTAKGAIQPRDVSGYKGWRIGADYAVAKNMIARVAYYHLKGKANNPETMKTIYTELISTF